MGTRATTRIQSKDDFIELYTRWDGFPGEIKSNLKSIFDIWKFTLQQFEKSISNKKYQSPYITKWLDNMNTLIYTAKTENDIVVIAGLLSSLSFNHHHPLDSYSPDKNYFKYYYKYNPDVIYDVELNKFNKKNKLKEIKETKLLLDDTHFIARIIYYEDTDNKFNIEDSKLNYTNIYVDGMTKEEFYLTLVELPLFLLETHYLLRNTMVESNDLFDNYGLLSKNIFDEYSLKSFYSPSVKFKEHKDDKDKDKNDILDHIWRFIPFDLGTSSLAIHLFLASAGKIKYLTEGQNKLYNKIETNEKIYLVDDEYRTNLLVYNSPDNSVINESNKRLSFINKSINSNNKSTFNHLQIKDFNFYAINFEKNMIDCFHILSSYLAD